MLFAPASPCAVVVIVPLVGVNFFLLPLHVRLQALFNRREALFERREARAEAGASRQVRVEGKISEQ